MTPSPSLADARTTLLSAPQVEDAWRVFLNRYWMLLVAWLQDTVEEKP